ncbi:hypothetical protein EV697_10844 [Bisgaardia hudsonensis]|uniref:UPF0319 protein EV697_10844 n=1 Tax=Bisgaardia hudsonensis TaxID=109472 RepID=A0A4R2MZT7_9PAST|nr:DUF2057 domain-containing protein [Bisgaardia hudsonensis]QLB12904.1 hypothetical protein A6A11_04420 [Bisgaardia hudsonensis]TCP11318.1 hypothetical protein EV697_10844 [Bisgaardia hudsonensis]
MKFRVNALAIVALISSTTSFASMINSSSNIDVLAVDGQKANKSLFKSKSSFEITDNQLHQLVVRVSEIVRYGSDRSLYESDPIIVTFKNTNEDLMIVAPKIENENDVNNFKANPKITLTTKSGNPIDTKQEILKQEGFLPGVNLIGNLSEYNASNSIASVSGFATSSLPTAMPGFAKTQKDKIVVQGENIAEQQLQYWFQQADKETQTRFINWAKKQK